MAHIGAHTIPGTVVTIIPGTPLSMILGIRPIMDGIVHIFGAGAIIHLGIIHTGAHTIGGVGVVIPMDGTTGHGTTIPPGLIGITVATAATMTTMAIVATTDALVLQPTATDVAE